MSRRPLSIASVFATAASVAALAMPGMASAAHEHPANNEQGVTIHPERFVSQTTRDQVRAETADAMKTGRLSYGESNFPNFAPPAGPGKTRDQVRAETADAMKNGRLSYGESNFPNFASPAGPGKTREEVINELLRESPAAREARLQSIAR